MTESMLAKGLAGGLPLAAVTGRAELMDAVVVGGLGGTYGGNKITFLTKRSIFWSLCCSI